MKKWYHYIKDVIIYLVILSLLVIVAVIYFKNVTEDSILDRIIQYVGAVVTILFGMIGIIEFSFDNGLLFLVPTSFQSYKERKLSEQTKKYLNEFFSKEGEYFSQHSNSRITYLLSQLGLNRNQLNDLRMSILTIKLMPLRSLDDARNKLIEIVKCPNIVLCQEKLPTDDLVYKGVKFFINFTDVMFMDDYRNQITDCLIFLIQQKAEEKGIQFNRVAISHSGNFLLGVSVSEKLNKALVRVTERPMILKSRSWIGNFDENNENNTIIVHDVLVTGKQIRESVQLIQTHTTIKALFCLVSRLCDTEKKKFENEMKIPIFSLLDLDDDYIMRLINYE